MFHVDYVLSFNRPRRELAVAGWCSVDTPIDELWIDCRGTRTPCLSGISRPDVARAFKPAFGQTGFLCRYPMPHGVAPATLIARHGDLERAVGEFVPQRSEQIHYPETAGDAYTTWLRAHESRLYWSRSEVDRFLPSLSRAPVVSVILPTYNTSLYHLHRCIESVTGQLYPHWELCITDDASPNPRVRQFLLERAANEPRIRLSFSEQNGGISAASNQSIEVSTGELITLLDHDDELHPSALLEVARCFDAHPDADLIYSDEDKIDQIGIHSYPSFKPEFDEDLLCGLDYIGHLVAMRSTLVKKVGGFRSDADGAQDWDLLLRVTSATERRRVRHIPKPLYHWRMHEDSTALTLDAKPYAIRAWNAVLQHHLHAETSCSVGDGLFLGSMRVVRSVPAHTRVSILCRACDGLHQRRALTASRSPCRVTFFELVLSNVHRADGADAQALMTVEDLESDVSIVVSCGIDSVNHHFLEELTAQALRDDCGIVGGTTLNARGSVLTAGLACLSDGTYVNRFEGLALQDPGYMGQARVVRAVPSIGPHLFAFRTSRLFDLNGLASLSEDSLSDVCTSLVCSAHAKGLKVLHTPWAVATLRSPATTYDPGPCPEPPRELMASQNLESYLRVAGILKAGHH